DKSYRYPNLTPLNLPLIDIKPTDKLSITLKDVVLQGMESTEVRDIVLDLPKRNIKVTVAFKRLTLDCQYDIDGQILVLPIKGNGPAKMIFDGVVVDYSFDYDLIKKTDGLQYIDPNIRPKVTYTLDNAHYKFDNLFNGDKNLGDTMNEFLNEHGPEVNKDLGESISQTINAVATNIIQGIITLVPYDKVFL
ncbi:hypothetical protein NQ317_019487, partial [Molorchus minor]